MKKRKKHLSMAIRGVIFGIVSFLSWLLAFFVILYFNISSDSISGMVLIFTIWAIPFLITIWMLEYFFIGNLNPLKYL